MNISTRHIFLSHVCTRNIIVSLVNLRLRVIFFPFISILQICLSTFIFIYDKYPSVIWSPHWYLSTNRLQISLYFASSPPKYVLILITCLPICFNCSSRNFSVYISRCFPDVQNFHNFLIVASITTETLVNFRIDSTSMKQNYTCSRNPGLKCSVDWIKLFGICTMLAFQHIQHFSLWDTNLFNFLLGRSLSISNFDMSFIYSSFTCPNCLCTIFWLSSSFWKNEWLTGAWCYVIRCCIFEVGFCYVYFYIVQQFSIYFFLNCA